MKWVTRERPKTDRIACPWLIKNFIDSEAEFLYVPADQVLKVAERKEAHSYDAPGAEYTHRDGLCSFEVLLDEYKLDDPALLLLARIVHGADVADDRDATPQSRGLLAVAEGFHLLNLGDHRQLELSLPVYDASTPGARTKSAAPTKTPDVSLVRAGFIPIPPGVKPGFDHADVHRAGRRMYVAHTGADRIDVLDCEACTYLHPLPAQLPGVAGVLIAEEHELLFSSDRGAAQVSVFRCSDEQLLGQVEVGPHPNGLAYDQQRRHLYSFNLGEPLGENCSASVVDLDSLSVIAELPLPGRPRWAVYDPQRDVVYANIEKPAQIAVINCDRAVIERALAVPGAGRTDSGSMLAGSSAPPMPATSSSSTATAARC